MKSPLQYGLKQKRKRKSLHQRLTGKMSTRFQRGHSASGTAGHSAPSLSRVRTFDTQGQCFSCNSAHNHSPGQTKPSKSDHSLTAKCVEAGKFTDLPAMDHIIVTRESTSHLLTKDFCRTSSPIAATSLHGRGKLL